jgi:hypothetical protein
MRVELRVRCLTRRASPWVIGAVCVAAFAGAPAALAAPRVLRVGTYHRIPGQFRTIQAAVDHARRGDGVLVAAGPKRAVGVSSNPASTGSSLRGKAGSSD